MTMTQEKWDSLSPAEREKVRDLSDLNPQLTPYVGWRVEVVTDYGETRRFIVGCSTGWKPIYLEILRRNSHGGMAVSRHYASVKPLYKVR
jgi:hypothetical protein